MQVGVLAPRERVVWERMRMCSSGKDSVLGVCISGPQKITTYMLSSIYNAPEGGGLMWRRNGLSSRQT